MARIEKAGGTAVQIRTDVTRQDDLHALVALARESFGRLDVLVGNAGVGTISPSTICASRSGTTWSTST